MRTNRSIQNFRQFQRNNVRVVQPAFSTEHCYELRQSQIDRNCVYLLAVPLGKALRNVALTQVIFSQEFVGLCKNIERFTIVMSQKSHD